MNEWLEVRLGDFFKVKHGFAFKGKGITTEKTSQILVTPGNFHIGGGFKSESYIVLANIAWTYLLHAYYRSNKIEYRYFEQHGQRKKFDKTKRGAYKYWELERCLNDDNCPIDNVAKSNLKFLIGLRHEIEIKGVRHD